MLGVLKMRLNKKQYYGGSQTLLQQRNIAMVLKNINQKGPISKRKIVNNIGISFAKVNSIILSLIERGIILEIGKEESNGGRPSALFKINPNYRLIIGCKLSHTQLRTVASNINGEIFKDDSQTFDFSLGKKYIVNSIINSIHNIIDQLGDSRDKILGIGVSVSGLVNPKTGSICHFPYLADCGDWSIEEIIEREFGLFCYVENIANAAALAELNFGIGRGIDNFLYLNVGTGLGLGIIINGKLYEGVTGSAGEFGHIMIDENGPLCECGNIGCLESFASIKAVVHKAKEMLKRGVISRLNNATEGNNEFVNFKMIYDAAIHGDKLSYSMIDEMGRYLGKGIATLINLFNPEMIILGGKLSGSFNLLMNSIETIVMKHALELPRKSTKIVFSQLGENAGVIGATIPIIEKFFDNPL